MLVEKLINSIVSKTHKNNCSRETVLQFFFDKLALLSQIRYTNSFGLRCTVAHRCAKILSLIARIEKQAVTFLRCYLVIKKSVGRQSRNIDIVSVVSRASGMGAL